MKVIFNLLISVGFILCEVPPPYPARGFRPSPPFNLPPRLNFNQRPQPQTSYGTPNTSPSKLVLPSSPQVQYGVPNTPNVENSGIQSNRSPNFNSRPPIPSTSYGEPITGNSGSPQNNFKIVNSQPQTAYGAPGNLNNNLNRPQTQYGAPDTRNVENFDQIRQLNLLLQLRQSSKLATQNQLGQSQNSNGNVIPTEQYLPVKDASDFRTDFTQSRNRDINFSQAQSSGRNEEQYLPQYPPVKEPANFRKEHDVPQFTPQRQVQNTPGNNFGASPNTPVNSFQINSQNAGIPTTQYQSSQFNNNAQNGINAGGLSQQYVPSENKPRDSSATNQRIPQNVASNFNQQPPINVNANTPQFVNGNPINFRRPTSQGSFDIQQADVRTLSQFQRNRNNNPVATQRQILRPNLRPAGPNQNPGLSSQEAERGTDEIYLPPTTTTARPIHRQINRPSVTPRPAEAPVQPEEQSTESDEEAGGPNIAVATAVSGAPGEQSFYLLQPDGRLQRVIYQKTRDEGDQENEYTANYLFQNIQADPSLVYSPLITLGK